MRATSPFACMSVPEEKGGRSSLDRSENKQSKEDTVSLCIVEPFVSVPLKSSPFVPFIEEIMVTQNEAPAGARNGLSQDDAVEL
jgi:hypothetical protein